MFSHSSQNETAESLAAVGGGYDQVGSQSFRCLKNLDARIAHHDFDFVAGFATDFLLLRGEDIVPRAVRLVRRCAISFAMPR